MGIYEMRRPEPDFEKATKHLESASNLAPYDQSIRHSLSELHLKIAEASGNDLQREFHLERAGEIARRITEDAKSNVDKAYAMHTIAKISIERIRAGMKSGSITQESMEALVQDAERAVGRGLQQYPGESSFHDAEAKLATLLSDSKRAREALQQGFRVNPRNHYIAIRLGRVLKKVGDEDGFTSVMKKALEANPGNKELHAAMGQSLVESPIYKHEDALYHLQRGFTQGDSNFETQFLYARELYLGGRFEDASRLFDHLSKARVEYELKITPRMPAAGRFNGSVTSKNVGFAFLRRDDVQSDVFCHASDMAPGQWEALRSGSRVTFEIAFTLKGPVAVRVAPR
jgi:cold shock CspA family protein